MNFKLTQNYFLLGVLAILMGCQPTRFKVLETYQAANTTNTNNTYSDSSTSTGTSSIAANSSNTSAANSSGSATTNDNTSSTATTQTTSNESDSQNNSAVSAILIPTVSSASFKNGEITIAGSNLTNVSSISLGDIAYSIISQSTDKIVASALSSLILSSKVAYSLVVKNAYGASTTSVTFTIDGISSTTDSAGNAMIGINTTSPTSALDVRNGNITNEGFNVKVFIGQARQNNNLDTAGLSWKDVPGVSVSFSVPRKMTLNLRALGSVGPLVYNNSHVGGHCAFRFVVDNTVPSTESTEWGQVIVGVNGIYSGQSGVYSQGWWSPWSMEDFITVEAGTHTIKVQQSGWSGTSFGCESRSASYSATKLIVEGI